MSLQHLAQHRELLVLLGLLATVLGRPVGVSSAVRQEHLDTIPKLRQRHRPQVGHSAHEALAGKGVSGSSSLAGTGALIMVYRRQSAFKILPVRG